MILVKRLLSKESVVGYRPNSSAESTAITPASDPAEQRLRFDPNLRWNFNPGYGD